MSWKGDVLFANYSLTCLIPDDFHFYNTRLSVKKLIGRSGRTVKGIFQVPGIIQDGMAFSSPAG
jgi:hypothetical protein